MTPTPQYHPETRGFLHAIAICLKEIRRSHPADYSQLNSQLREVCDAGTLTDAIAIIEDAIVLLEEKSN